jgi:hypothetical protein
MQFISIKEIVYTFGFFLGSHSLVVQLNLKYMVILLLIQILCLANLEGKHHMVLFIKQCFMSITYQKNGNHTAAYY